MSNYKDIPADPKIYVENSLMAKQPEVTLWDFIENRPDKEYEKWAKDIGSDLTTEYEAKPLSRLDINEQDFIDFMLNNKETCQKKYYEKRPYHRSRLCRCFLIGFPLCFLIKKFEIFCVHNLFALRLVLVSVRFHKDVEVAFVVSFHFIQLFFGPILSKTCSFSFFLFLFDLIIVLLDLLIIPNRDFSSVKIFGLALREGNSAIAHLDWQVDLVSGAPFEARCLARRE